ncbi:hypothetical protein [Pseudonocardia acidicola]|uniref:Cytochrome P450 n=1 Tax=Pseudonocardia acidicola TaxID=2724939 RepID=A0ABX1SGJ2_9PSEU|nr:hypothetical protein [Pseudonocardia acidicola]NMH99672.1 hypothetical protein [Pseudonocardia acidicola]
MTVRATQLVIDIGGMTNQAGYPVTVVYAAGKRDPDCVRDPDRFDPDRRNTRHPGFGCGIRYCFGTPSARLETRVAPTEFARRVVNPHLTADPPNLRPSEPNPILRGPRHLLVDFDECAARLSPDRCSFPGRDVTAGRACAIRSTETAPHLKLVHRSFT